MYAYNRYTFSLAFVWDNMKVMQMNYYTHYNERLENKRKQWKASNFLITHHTNVTFLNVTK